AIGTRDQQMHLPGSFSLFAQITRRGKNVAVHNHPTEVTIGIISTDNKLPLPNIMLIARPGPMQSGQVPSGCRTEQLGKRPTAPSGLTLGFPCRLLPLKFVRISVHDPDRQRIKLKLMNGRSYYLQLYASPGEQELLFDRWLSLIYLLHHPPDCYLHPNSCMPRDNLSVQILEKGKGAGGQCCKSSWREQQQSESHPRAKHRDQAGPQLGAQRA
uniref:Golgi associated RAB2 interactor protein-like Rab2B-binding domain-containing protein n=1 Tax=Terrapene triunguis TaxID=2587831 RepID=A0A674J1Y7_9SAUR